MVVVMEVVGGRRERGRNSQMCLTLLHSERPKLHRVFAILNAIGLININYVFNLYDLPSRVCSCVCTYYTSNNICMFFGKI